MFTSNGHAQAFSIHKNHSYNLIKIDSFSNTLTWGGSKSTNVPEERRVSEAAGSRIRRDWLVTENNMVQLNLHWSEANGRDGVGTWGVP